jgi:hypothetical protein
MSDFTKFLLKAFVRKGLTVLGSVLLAHGVISESEAGGFVSQYLEEVLGLALLGASSVWTFIYQRYVRRKVTTALKLPEGANPATLEVVMAAGTRAAASG